MDRLRRGKITKEELKKFVSTRSWYQTIKFEDDVISRGPVWCGEVAWENMKRFLPPSLEGMRILDLGHNAGLFCVYSALMGAQEVVGIDWPGWRPKWDFKEQQDFVKKYFEQKHGRELNIRYIEGKMEDVLTTQDLGVFDYVYAIASIYYSEGDKTVKALARIAKNAIVRLRDENRIAKFTGLFKKYNFGCIAEYRENLSERFGRADDFYMYHFINLNLMMASEN